MGLKFKTEEDRENALAELGDFEFGLDAEKSSKFDEIMAAMIDPEFQETGSTPPASEELAQPADTSSVSDDETITISKKDLGKYPSFGHVLKALEEKEKTINGQTEFIRSKLSQPAPAPTQTPPKEETKPKETEAEISKVKEKIGGVKAKYEEAIRKSNELESRVDSDSDFQYTDEYRRAAREIQREKDGLILEHNSLVGEQTDLMDQYRSELRETRAGLERRANADKEAEALSLQQKQTQRYIDELQGVDDPDYKLSRPVMDLDKENRTHRANVALAYFGRPAATNDEIEIAMQQAQLGNPDLSHKCSIMGFSMKPSPDVEKYLRGCEMLDYMEGYRTDPRTGKGYQLTKVENGVVVPVKFNSLKEAIEDHRRNNGYYERKANDNFQSGADSYANATMRRDRGAVELGASDQRSSTKNAEWALSIVQNADMELAMLKERQGDSRMINDINEALAIIDKLE